VRVTRMVVPRVCDMLACIARARFVRCASLAPRVERWCSDTASDAAWKTITGALAIYRRDRTAALPALLEAVDAAPRAQKLDARALLQVRCTVDAVAPGEADRSVSGGYRLVMSIKLRLAE